jgi:TolB-like protein
LDSCQREKEVVRDASITHLTAKRLDVFTIGLIVVALAFVLADRVWFSPRLAVQLEAPEAVVTDPVSPPDSECQYPPNSIAVLPFVNMSDDPGNEYFSDGISEELLNLLAKIPELQVIARTSSFSFKGKGVRISDVARELNVGHVLEGSVRKVGNQVRVTAQLIKADSEIHLWSETYDRELENIFEVQDEISAAVIESLKEHLGFEIEAVPREIAAVNTEGHDAFLRGRHLVAQRTAVAIEGAVREFERAIALEPEYALAHAELAIATLFLGIYGDLALTEALTRATPHVERAMTLDPTLAEAHAATGYILRFQDNAEEALTHFRQAIRINPNYSLVHNGIGVLLSDHLGRYNEALAVHQTALRLDPLLIPANTNRIRGLIERNRLAEADRKLENLASISQLMYAIWHGSRISLNGRWANAVLGNLNALRISPENVGQRDDLSRQFAILDLEKEALSISENPLPVVFSLLGKHGDAVLTAEARLARDHIYLTARRHLGLALAAAGNYARARPILEEMWQRSGGRVTCRGPFQVPGRMCAGLARPGSPLRTWVATKPSCSQASTIRRGLPPIWRVITRRVLL